MSNELTPVQSSQSVEVFVSYSHKDETLRKKLEAHLRTLSGEGIISLWHDRNITPGKDWANEIDSNLNTAHIILLLVSANFFDSNYCYGIELRRALERHEAGVARVIPIIIKPVDWQNAPFAKLNALPKDGKAVTTWRNRDEAFVDVARGIREAARELTTNSKPKLEYRKEVEELVRSDKGAISSISRIILDKSRDRVDLVAQDAALIEEEVLQAYREYEQNLQVYKQELLKEFSKDKGRLSEDSRKKLKQLQRALKLKDEDITQVKQEELPSDLLRQLEETQEKVNDVTQELDRVRLQMKQNEISQALDKFLLSTQQLDLEGQKANLEEDLKDLKDLVQYMRLHQKVMEWVDADPVKMAEETVEEVLAEHPEWKNRGGKVDSPERIKQFWYNIEDYLDWIHESTTIYEPLPLEQINITPAFDRDVYLEAFKVIQRRAVRELSPDVVAALKIYTSYLIKYFTRSD